jgi:hypothetical protein
LGSRVEVTRSTTLLTLFTILSLLAFYCSTVVVDLVSVFAVPVAVPVVPVAVPVVPVVPVAVDPDYVPDDVLASLPNRLDNYELRLLATAVV